LKIAGIAMKTFSIKIPQHFSVDTSSNPSLISTVRLQLRHLKSCVGIIGPSFNAQGPTA
jgi:hypothetical protein